MQGFIAGASSLGSTEIRFQQPGLQQPPSTQQGQLVLSRENHLYIGLTLNLLLPSLTGNRDQNGNLLTTEFGLCSYRDHQTLGMQEMPENSPAGKVSFPTEIDRAARHPPNRSASTLCRCYSRGRLGRCV